MYETNPRRFVSLLTRKTLALVLAGGRGSRLYELTATVQNLRWMVNCSVNRHQITG